MNMENLLEKEEIDRILKIESKIEKRGKEIQKKYNFEIPDYVLHEIVEKEGESSSVVIPVKNYEVEYLTVSQSWISVLALMSVIVLPFGFIVIGFVIWFRRRKL